MSRAIRELQLYLYDQAKNSPSKPHTDLYRYLSEWCVLEEAFIRARKTTSTDGNLNRALNYQLRSKTDEAYGYLQQIGLSLEKGTYQPGKVYHFEVPKPGKPGEFRRVAMLCATDKIVHHALKIVLEPIIEARLSRKAYAFRPGKSIWDQLHALRKTIDLDPSRFTCGLVVDIESFFDRIDHRRLITDVKRLTQETPFIKLMQTLLNQVATATTGFFSKRPVGVLQGSPLSPLLANWHLDTFDRAWDHQYGKTNPLFRYADDIVVLSNGVSQANQVRRKVISTLRSKVNLTIAHKKTTIELLEHGLPILGMKLLRKHDSFLDEQRTLIVTDAERIQEAMQTVKNDVDNICADRPLGKQFEKINQRLRGWFQVWQYASDASTAFESIDLFVYRLVRAKLKSLLNISHAQLNDLYSSRADTGHPTWQADGVRILTMQSLPRQFFRAKEVKYPWQVESAQASAIPQTVAPVKLLTREQSVQVPIKTADIPLPQKPK